MTASRWNTFDTKTILDNPDWAEADLGMRELYLRMNFQSSDPEAGQEQTFPSTIGDGTQTESKIPSVLPILPLRGLVVYPETAVPLTIGQPRSIRLVDDVMSSDERLIGLVTSRDAELEVPGPDDLHDIGTVAMIHRLFR